MTQHVWERLDAVTVTIPARQYLQLHAIHRTALALALSIGNGNYAGPDDIEVENLVAALTGQEASIRASAMRAVLLARALDEGSAP